MPLDPQAAQVLSTLAATGAPPIHRQSVAQARIGAYRLQEFFGPPEPIGAVENRFIPGPTADLPVRIYTPIGEPVPVRDRRPALIYFHGSGFVISNIAIFDNPSRVLANRAGCLVISVNYQKAPEHKFPVPFDDAYAATDWVFTNADELDINRDRIGVIGDSAGGTLAAAVCLKARDQQGPRIAVQILVHAPTQYGRVTPSMVENSAGMLLETADIHWFYEKYLRSKADAQNPYVSPMAAKSVTGLPPALIVTAEYDPLRDEGEEYGERLRAATVPVTIHRYSGMIHGFYGMIGALDPARRLFDEIAAFTQGYLHVPPGYEIHGSGK